MLPVVRPVNCNVSVPPVKVLSTQLPLTGTKLVEQFEEVYNCTTASKDAEPTTVTVCDVAAATKVYHTSFCVLVKEHDVELVVCDAKATLPVMDTQLISVVRVIAPHTSLLTGAVRTHVVNVVVDGTEEPSWNTR